MSSAEYKFEQTEFTTDVSAENISDDLREFLHIYTASQQADGNPQKLTEELVNRYLDKLDISTTYAMSLDGELVGAALVDIDYEHARMWVEGIAVNPDYREAGIGTYAMRQLARVAIQAGCDRLSGLAQPNESTLQFYTKLGFYQDDRIGTPEDYDGLVPMSVDLPAPKLTNE